MATPQHDKAVRFRALHAGPDAFVIPNPWDAGSTLSWPGRYARGQKELTSVCVEKRGASTACCGFMPKTSRLSTICRSAWAWSSPPGQPTVVVGTPSSQMR